MSPNKLQIYNSWLEIKCLKFWLKTGKLFTFFSIEYGDLSISEWALWNWICCLSLKHWSEVACITLDLYTTCDVCIRVATSSDKGSLRMNSLQKSKVRKLLDENPQNREPFTNWRNPFGFLYTCTVNILIASKTFSSTEFR